MSKKMTSMPWKKILPFVTALLGGCATATPELAELTILVAEARIDKADSIGNEWQNSRMLLNQAQEEFKKGNLPAATTLAREARYQGEMALKQAETQRNAAPWQFK